MWDMSLAIVLKLVDLQPVNKCDTSGVCRWHARSAADVSNVGRLCFHSIVQEDITHVNSGAYSLFLERSYGLAVAGVHKIL